MDESVEIDEDIEDYGDDDFEEDSPVKGKGSKGGTPGKSSKGNTPAKGEGKVPALPLPAPSAQVRPPLWGYNPV